MRRFVSEDTGVAVPKAEFGQGCLGRPVIAAGVDGAGRERVAGSVLTAGADGASRGRQAGSVLVAGVDEAGRGCLAGPVVAAAVVLHPGRPVDGLSDSKRLSPARRKRLATLIRRRARAFAVALATPREIDDLNILQATLRAMERAVRGLRIEPDLVQVDGNQAPRLKGDGPAVQPAVQTVVGGDRLVPAISAASILAKVYRDRLMGFWHAPPSRLRIQRQQGLSHTRALGRAGQAGPLRDPPAQFRAGAPQLARCAEYSMSGFVHLSVHSEYSLADGIVRVPELAATARAQGMPAVALTDLMNVFAMVKFYRAAIGQGLKPLIGAEIRVAESPQDAVATRLTLLCANAGGFQNLSRLLSLAYSGRQGRGEVLVLKRWLEPESLEGLIALSGGQFGEIGRTLLGTRPERAADVLAGWLERFPGCFYLELHRVGWPEEGEYLDECVRLAATHGVPVVATNPVRFLHPDNQREDEPNDFEAHEVRVCIQQGKTLRDPRRSRDYTRQQYLKSSAEMEELFGDLPEALSNSVEIARRCSFELELGRPCLPDFEVPGGQSAADHLRAMALRGLGKRGVSRAANGSDRASESTKVNEPPQSSESGAANGSGKANGSIPFSDYEARLASELDVICEMASRGTS